MDHDLFATINGLAGRERVLDVTSVALSRFGPFLLLVALLPDLVPPRYRCEARTASAACLDCGHWDSEHCSSIRSSFVSGTDHVPSPPRLPIFCRRMILRFQATMQRSFAVAAGLFLVSKRVGVPALIFAGLIGLARVYTGPALRERRRRRRANRDPRDSRGRTSQTSVGTLPRRGPSP